MPPGGHNNFLGQNNIKNEISTIKLLRVQIFSKIRKLLKNHYLRGVLNIWGGKMPPVVTTTLKITILDGGFLTFLRSKMPPGGELEFSRHIHYDFLKGNHKGSFHTKN